MAAPPRAVRLLSHTRMHTHIHSHPHPHPLPRFQNGSMVPGAPLTQAQEEDLPDDDDLGMPPGAMRALY